jgi:hypothetical protein
MIFHYTTNWREGLVNQMWIQEIEESYDVYKYVAIAFNPEKNVSMVMSNPRGYYDTLQWVRKFCGSFCILWIMITLAIGGGIITLFSILFYLEDRDGVGIYDPDPSASYRHNQKRKNRNWSIMKYEVQLYQGGKVFIEEVYAGNPKEARETAQIRNPSCKVIGVNVTFR